MTNFHDEIALEKFRSKEWICDFESGKIYRVIPGTHVGAYRIIGTTKKGQGVGKTHVMYHRAVWIAAHNQVIPDGLQIDHIDGNPENNKPENLQVCTDKENKNNPATKQKRYGETNPNAKLSNADVADINRRLEVAENLPPQARRHVVGRIAGDYGISDTHVRRIKKGINRAGMDASARKEAEQCQL